MSENRRGGFFLTHIVFNAANLKSSPLSSMIIHLHFLVLRFQHSRQWYHPDITACRP